MSSTKTFSEFLVEQNLVSAEDLVALLIEQAKTLPLPAEVAREQKLLSAAQILSVFTQQMKTGSDFAKACQDLKLWTPALAAALSAENDRLRIPVVQLLQTTGKVTTEKLVLALDTYLSETARPSVSISAVASVDTIIAAAMPTVEEAPVAVVAEAAASAHAESSGDSPMDHFREFYTEAMQAKMISLAKEWDQSELDITTALIDRVHGIVGAARFAKLANIEDMFRNAESNIRALADCATPLPFPAIEAFRLELCQAFEQGWALRNSPAPESVEHSEAAV